MITRHDGIGIRGLSVCVPAQVEETLESLYADAEARVRFSKNTGVQRRRLCRPDQYCSDLALEAGDRLLEALGWDRSEVGALIFVTQTPDLAMPATACILQDKLGLPKTCGAFDVNLGCSGYTYGLRLAASFLQPEGIRKVLLLVGDHAGKRRTLMGRKKTPPLFGDAASATALEWDADAAPMHVEMMTDGSGWQAITERRPGGRPFIEGETFHHEILDSGEVVIDTMSRMRGEDVLNFSTREAPAAVLRMLEETGLGKDEVDYFVFHQANRMINKLIRRRLDLPEDRVPGSLTDFGNTSSATIPVTMVHALQERLEKDPLTLLCSGFGVGLSWCLVLLRTRGMKCLPLIEQ